MREINTNDKRFHDGDGRSEMGTIVTADWLNAVQDELVGLVTGFGGEVDSDVKNQIFTLLNTAIGNKASKSEFTSFLDLFIGVPIAIPTVALPEINIPGYTVTALDGGRFSTSIYPKLAKVYPSGVKPDARGEFIRGWDNGRNVDNGRELLSQQKASAQAFDPHIASIASYSLVNRIGDAYENLSFDWVSWSHYQDAMIAYFHLGNTDTEEKALADINFLLTKQTGGTESYRKSVATKDTMRGWELGGVRPRNIAYQYVCLAA